MEEKRGKRSRSVCDRDETITGWWGDK